jgi:hypothetical protein
LRQPRRLFGCESHCLSGCHGCHHNGCIVMVQGLVWGMSAGTTA